MAMTPNTWHIINISAIASPPWTPGTYAAPHPFVIDAIASGAALLVFCLSDAGPGYSATIVGLNGEASIPSDAVTVASTPAMRSDVLTSGATWYSVRNTASGGAWMWYDDQRGQVGSLALPPALGGFIS
jgi:hypothetical protein